MSWKWSQGPASEPGSSELGQGGDFGPDPPPGRDPEQGGRAIQLEPRLSKG